MYMNLEQRYNAAPETTYVGRVKTTQVASVGVGKGVDFMDAGARAGGTVDQMQSNFERRREGDVTVVQGGSETATYGASDRKGLSRWYGRALNYAFTDPRASNNYIQDSVWTTYKSMRVGTRDSWSDNTTNFHRWTPSTKFNRATVLSELAKTRATSKSAPTPQ